MNKVEKLISKINNLNLMKVKSSDLVDIICEYGLVNSIVDDYGEFSKYQLKTRSESGIYQTPTQIAECIIDLLEYDIKSYVELGVFQGGNFLLMSTILKHKYEDVECLAVDVTDIYLNDDVKPYITNFKKGTSNDLKGIGFDLAFIDAGHEYDEVKIDYENIGKYSKIVMFHDINNRVCPGVEKFWNEVKIGKKYKEYLYQTDNLKVHGIGVLFN